MSLLPMRLFIILFSLASCSMSAVDWPQFRGPQRTGISAETQWTHMWPADGPARLWKAEVGIGYSAVSIADGRLYTMGNADDRDTVWCLDAKTGKELWHHTYDSPLDPKYYPGGPSSTPTVVNNFVYTCSKAGLVLCLDAVSGAVRWQRDLQAAGTIRPKWGYASSVLIIDEMVIINAGQNGVALKTTDGSEVWNSGAGTSGYASPVHFLQHGKPMLAMFGEDALHGVALTSGTLEWTIPWKTNYGENSPDPIIIEDKIFISTGHGLGSSLFTLPANGQPSEIWNNKEYGNHLASSVFLAGHFYGFTGRVNKNDGHLGCLNATTGQQLWTAPLRGSLILAGERLLIASLSGELIVAEANPHAYKELARAQVLGGSVWTTPTLANGLIYVRNSKGQLVCVQVKTDD